MALTLTVIRSKASTLRGLQFVVLGLTFFESNKVQIPSEAEERESDEANSSDNWLLVSKKMLFCRRL